MNLYSFVIGQVGIHGFNLGDKTVAAWINPVKPENSSLQLLSHSASESQRCENIKVNKQRVRKAAVKPIY